MHVCTCLNGAILRSLEDTRTRIPSQRPVLCSEFDDCPGGGARSVHLARVDLGGTVAARGPATPAWTRPWRAPSRAGVLAPREDRSVPVGRVLRWTGVAAAMGVAGLLGAVAAGRGPAGRGADPGRGAPAVASAVGPARPEASPTVAGDDPAPTPHRAAMDAARLPAVAVARSPGPPSRRPSSLRVSRADREDREVEAPPAIPTGPGIYSVDEGLARLAAGVTPAPTPAGVNRVAAAAAAPAGAGLAARLQAAAGAPGGAERVAAPAPDPTVMGMLRATTAPEVVAPAPPAAEVLPPALDAAMISRWLAGARAQARACVERFGVPRQLTQARLRVTGATGAVASVELVGGLAGTAAGTCIENALRRGRLPRFAGAEQVVTAPVVTP